MNRPLGLSLIVMLLGSLALGTVIFSVEVTQGSIVSSTVISSDTTWTAAESPYELQGPVAINPGATLTIEPGTTINLNTNYIQVNGTLIAKGTSTQHIFFNNGFIAFTKLCNGWSETTNSGSIIQNANFTSAYGNTRYRYAAQITVEGASPKLTGLSNVATVDIADGGGSQTLTNNIIGHLVIHGSQTISKNVVDNMDAFGGMYIFNNTIGRLGVDKAPSVIGNLINNMIIRGAPFVKNNVFDSYVVIEEGSPIMTNNTIQGGVSGEYCNSPIIWSNKISLAPRDSDSSIVLLKCTGQPVIGNNLITGIETPAFEYSDDLYGARRLTAGPFNVAYGIQISGNATVTNNIISGCIKADILVNSGNTTIQSNALNGKGVILNSDLAQVNYNNFQKGGGIYLWGKVTSDIDASNNWWGTTNNFEIDQAMHDFADDFNLGKVNYEPLLNAPNPNAAPNSNQPMPTPIPSPTATPTVTPQPPSSHFFDYPLSLEQSVIIGLVIVVATLLIIVAILLKRKRN
jgi:hypothetical protein